MAVMKKNDKRYGGITDALKQVLAMPDPDLKVKGTLEIGTEEAQKKLQKTKFTISPSLEFDIPKTLEPQAKKIAKSLEGIINKQLQHPIRANSFDSVKKYLDDQTIDGKITRFAQERMKKEHDISSMSQKDIDDLLVKYEQMLLVNRNVLALNKQMASIPTGSGHKREASGIFAQPISLDADKIREQTLSLKKYQAFVDLYVKLSEETGHKLSSSTESMYLPDKQSEFFEYQKKQMYARLAQGSGFADILQKADDDSSLPDINALLEFVKKYREDNQSVADSATKEAEKYAKDSAKVASKLADIMSKSQEEVRKILKSSFEPIVLRKDEVDFDDVIFPDKSRVTWMRKFFGAMAILRANNDEYLKSDLGRKMNDSYEKAKKQIEQDIEIYKKNPDYVYDTYMQMVIEQSELLASENAPKSSDTDSQKPQKQRISRKRKTAKDNTEESKANEEVAQTTEQLGTTEEAVAESQKKLKKTRQKSNESQKNAEDDGKAVEESTSASKKRTSKKKKEAEQTKKEIDATKKADDAQKQLEQAEEQTTKRRKKKKQEQEDNSTSEKANPTTYEQWMTNLKKTLNVKSKKKMIELTEMFGTMYTNGSDNNIDYVLNQYAYIQSVRQALSNGIDLSVLYRSDDLMELMQDKTVLPELEANLKAFGDIYDNIIKSGGESLLGLSDESLSPEKADAVRTLKEYIGELVSRFVGALELDEEEAYQLFAKQWQINNFVSKRTGSEDFINVANLLPDDVVSKAKEYLIKHLQESQEKLKNGQFSGDYDRAIAQNAYNTLSLRAIRYGWAEDAQPYLGDYSADDTKTLSNIVNVTKTYLKRIEKSGADTKKMTPLFKDTLFQFVSEILSFNANGASDGLYDRLSQLKDDLNRRIEEIGGAKDFFGDISQYLPKQEAEPMPIVKNAQESADALDNATESAQNLLTTLKLIREESGKYHTEDMRFEISKQGRYFTASERDATTGEYVQMSQFSSDKKLTLTAVKNGLLEIYNSNGTASAISASAEAIAESAQGQADAAKKAEQASEQTAESASEQEQASKQMEKATQQTAESMQQQSEVNKKNEDNEKPALTERNHQIQRSDQLTRAVALEYANLYFSRSKIQDKISSSDIQNLADEIFNYWKYSDYMSDQEMDARISAFLGNRKIAHSNILGLSPYVFGKSSRHVDEVLSMGAYNMYATEEDLEGAKKRLPQQPQSSIPNTEQLEQQNKQLEDSSKDAAKAEDSLVDANNRVKESATETAEAVKKQASQQKEISDSASQQGTSSKQQTQENEPAHETKKPTTVSSGKPAILKKPDAPEKPQQASHLPPKPRQELPQLNSAEAIAQAISQLAERNAQLSEFIIKDLDHSAEIGIPMAQANQISREIENLFKLGDKQENIDIMSPYIDDFLRGKSTSKDSAVNILKNIFEEYEDSDIDKLAFALETSKARIANTAYSRFKSSMSSPALEEKKEQQSTEPKAEVGKQEENKQVQTKTPDVDKSPLADSLKFARTLLDTYLGVPNSGKLWNTAKQIKGYFNGSATSEETASGIYDIVSGSEALKEFSPDELKSIIMLWLEWAKTARDASEAGRELAQENKKVADSGKAMSNNPPTSVNPTPEPSEPQTQPRKEPTAKKVNNTQEHVDDDSLQLADEKSRRMVDIDNYVAQLKKFGLYSEQMKTQQIDKLYQELNNATNKNGLETFDFLFGNLKQTLDPIMDSIKKDYDEIIAKQKEYISLTQQLAKAKAKPNADTDTGKAEIAELEAKQQQAKQELDAAQSKSKNSAYKSYVQQDVDKNQQSLELEKQRIAAEKELDQVQRRNQAQQTYDAQIKKINEYKTAVEQFRLALGKVLKDTASTGVADFTDAQDWFKKIQTLQEDIKGFDINKWATENSGLFGSDKTDKMKESYVSSLNKTNNLFDNTQQQNIDGLIKLYQRLRQEQNDLFKMSANPNKTTKEFERQMQVVSSLTQAFETLRNGFDQMFGQGFTDKLIAPVKQNFDDLDSIVQAGNLQSALSQLESVKSKIKDTGTISQIAKAQIQAYADEFKNLNDQFSSGEKDEANYLLTFKGLTDDMNDANKSWTAGFWTAGQGKDLLNIESQIVSLERMGQVIQKVPEYSEKLQNFRTQLVNLYEGISNGSMDTQTAQGNIKKLFDSLFVFKKQANQYNQVNRSGELIGVGKVEQGNIESALAQIREYALSHSLGEITSSKTLKNGDISVELKNEEGIITTLIAKYNELHGVRVKVTSQVKEEKGIFSGMKDIFGELGSALTRFASGYMIVMKFTNAIKQGYQTLLTYDKALTTISYTMDLSNSQLNRLGESAIQMAKDLSMSMQNTLSIYQIYANMQTSASEIAETAKPTAILSNLSGVDASTAADQIQGVLQQFNMLKDATQSTADVSMHIVDVFDKISANIALDYAKGIKVISDAVQASGQVAYDAGLSFEQLAAISAKVAERTREDGSSIGNAIKTISTRISKVSKMPQYADEVDNATLSNASASLNAIGVQVYNVDGSFRDLSVILSELNEKWDSLTDAQRANISFNIAATRQTNSCLGVQ